VQNKNACSIVMASLLFLVTLNAAQVEAASTHSVDPKSIEAFAQRIGWGTLGGLAGGFTCATTWALSTGSSTWGSLMDDPAKWHNSPSQDFKIFKNFYISCSSITTTTVLFYHAAINDASLMTKDLLIPALGTAFFAWLGNFGGLKVNASGRLDHDLESIDAPSWLRILVDMLHPSSLGSLFASAIFPTIVYVL